MAITRVGLTGAMTAYATFVAKEAAAVFAATADWLVRCASDDVYVVVDAGDVIVRIPPDDPTGVM